MLAFHDMEKEKKKAKVWDKLTIFIVLGMVAIFTLNRMNLEHGAYDEQIEKITKEGRPQMLYVLATGFIRRETGLGLDTSFVEFGDLHKYGRHGNEYLFGGSYTRPDGVSVRFEATIIESDEGIELTNYVEK